MLGDIRRTQQIIISTIPEGGIVVGDASVVEAVDGHSRPVGSGIGISVRVNPCIDRSRASHNPPVYVRQCRDAVGDAGSQRQGRSGCLQPSPSSAGDSPRASWWGSSAASPAFRKTPLRLPSRLPRPPNNQGKTRLASPQGAQAARTTPNPHAHQCTKTPIITMPNSSLAIKSVDGIGWHPEGLQWLFFLVSFVGGKGGGECVIGEVAMSLQDDLFEKIQSLPREQQLIVRALLDQLAPVAETKQTAAESVSK